MARALDSRQLSQVSFFFQMSSTFEIDYSTETSHLCLLAAAKQVPVCPCSCHS